MTDPNAPVAGPQVSAGELLRVAREAAGVHIGVLATTLKVPVRKLELLEAGRFEELPDATFTRALALSVCRVLKADPTPVLAALPRQEAVASTLELVHQGMNAPFAGRAGMPAAVMRQATHRTRWMATALLVVAIAAAGWAYGLDRLLFRPGGSGMSPDASGVASTAASSLPGASVGALVSGAAVSAAASASASSPLVQTVHGLPVATPLQASTPLDSSVTVTEASWIEVVDLQGRLLWTRTLTPGEVVALEGASGIRLTVGNAAGTQVRWRGQVVDLAGSTRDNVARLELK